MIIGKEVLPFILAFFLLSGVSTGRDTLFVFEVYRLVEENFTLLKKDPLLDMQFRLMEQNFQSAYLPEINAMGLATYQSDVVKLPFQIPGQEMLDLPHGRFQAYIDLKQLIYDGGMTRLNADLAGKETVINKQQLRVSLQSLKEQTLNIFFSIGIMKKTESIILNSKDLLEQKQRILGEAFEGGIIDESGVLRIKAEIMKLEQKIDEVRQQTVGLAEILSLLTGTQIAPEIEFVIPTGLEIDLTDEFKRPELVLLSLQQEKLASMSELHEASKQPKIFAFGQGGLGYPNPLNIFNNEISPFGMVGIRCTYHIWDWGNRQREQEILRLQSQMLETDRENVIRNIDIQLQTHIEKIRELTQTIEKDRELIRVRQEILQMTSRQLDEGIIGSNDYIEAVHEEQDAKLKMESNRILLELAKANYLNQKGTFFTTIN
jgi:outer membrane protein TolC